MAILDPDYKIAIGWNNAVGLVRWNTISVSGVNLVDPTQTWTQFQDGQRQRLGDLSIGYFGYPRTQWNIDYLTTAQYKYLFDTFQGEQVTIRDSIDQVSFANYNAVFEIEQRAGLSNRATFLQSGVPESINLTGLSWTQVIITYTALEPI